VLAAHTLVLCQMFHRIVHRIAMSGLTTSIPVKRISALL
jgi:hypothetical protein